MALTPKDKQLLKAKAHTLKPIVFIGNQGLSDNVKNEIDRGLEDHELIKVRMTGVEREEKKPLLLEICTLFKAEAIQLVGNIMTLYRKSNK